MDNNVLYIFESCEKLKSDLLDYIKKLSQSQKELVALAYINRQSDIFEYSNDRSKIFKKNIFDLYISELKRGIDTEKDYSSYTLELDVLIPETDDSGGWMSDFMQNALISLYCFLNFIEEKEDYLFAEIVGKVLDNVDVLWYRNNLYEDKEESERIQFGKEISILCDAIVKVKNINGERDVVNFVDGLKKIPLY